ncbi:MAG: D-alanyl-D-alanine carboxypeptidase family protein [Acidimicrobiia bacterium]
MRRTSPGRGISLVLFVAWLAFQSVAPAGAAEIPDYEPDEFDLLFRTAPLDNLAEIGPAPSITGSSGVDARIRRLAEDRGYRRRPLPAGTLGQADGVLMQAAMAFGWEALQSAARAAGVSIQAVSGYRSHADQVAVFVGKLRGTGDSAIATRLRTAAAPGYSKHHTGYAVDVTAPGAQFYGFGGTAAWRWLSADNAEAAKRNGFIPSYPSGASAQGPIPEPWEWVYVGVDVVTCGRATIGMPAGSFDDIVSCGEYPLARGAAVHIAARALGLWPVGDPAAGAFDDDEGLAFEPEADLMASMGLLAGCGERQVCPFDYLSRDELAAFAVGAFGIEPESDLLADIDGSEGRAARSDLVGLVLAGYDSGELTRPGRLVDSLDSVFAADIVWLVSEGISRGCNPPFNDLFCGDDPVTRGQMAAFLSRALGLAHGDAAFSDTAGHVFADDAARLAAAGITRGCNPPANDRFCPDEVVTRGQMAAFLSRALQLPDADGSFEDTAGDVFADDAARLAAAGITLGCNPPANDRFCPDDPVTRGQMAAFLQRALTR